LGLQGSSRQGFERAAKTADQTTCVISNVHASQLNAFISHPPNQTNTTLQSMMAGMAASMGAGGAGMGMGMGSKPPGQPPGSSLPSSSGMGGAAAAQQQQHQQHQQHQQMGYDPSGGAGMIGPSLGPGGMHGGGMHGGMGMGGAGMGMGGGMGMHGGMGGMMMGGMGMGMGGGPASALAAAKAWKLFVGQISFDLSEDQLTPYFSQFGTILEFALPRTDGRSRGYAFLTYSSQTEAQAAIDGANGAIVPSDPRARPLTVRWADAKGR